MAEAQHLTKRGPVRAVSALCNCTGHTPVTSALAVRHTGVAAKSFLVSILNKLILVTGVSHCGQKGI